MRTSSFLTPLVFAASSLAQAVPEGIAPSSPPPSGCETSANGNFTIGTLKLGHKKRETAKEAADGALFCNLKDGVLRDSYARTGSVVANRQFQFDGPPQAGAIYTGGFSICKNGSLAIGGTTRWWQCSSGPFYNLYDQWIGAQCEEIRIQVQLVNQPSASASASASATGGAGSQSSPVASVVSSLATISGQLSTVSASAVGPTASASRNGTASATSGIVSGATLSPSASRASTAAAAGASGSGAPAAPPAGGAAASHFGGSVAGAVVAFVGAALVL